MDWTKELPNNTESHGITIPVYLDRESIKALDHSQRLCDHANWLVHVGKHVNRIPPGKESDELSRMIAKLKQAKTCYNSLADNDKSRIEDFQGAETLERMIVFAENCLEKPLPNKSKLENLYWTFASTGTPEWRKIGRPDFPTEFQVFMAVVIRLVDGDPDNKSVEDYISRSTKAYQRIVVGQKREK